MEADHQQLRPIARQILLAGQPLPPHPLLPPPRAASISLGGPLLAVEVVVLANLALQVLAAVQGELLAILSSWVLLEAALEAALLAILALQVLAAVQVLLAILSSLPGWVASALLAIALQLLESPECVDRLESSPLCASSPARFSLPLRGCEATWIFFAACCTKMVPRQPPRLQS